jgi:hypothetical protein
MLEILSVITLLLLVTAIAAACIYLRALTADLLGIASLVRQISENHRAELMVGMTATSGRLDEIRLAIAELPQKGKPGRKPATRSTSTGAKRGRPPKVAAPAPALPTPDPRQFDAWGHPPTPEGQPAAANESTGTLPEPL